MGCRSDEPRVEPGGRRLARRARFREGRSRCALKRSPQDAAVVAALHCATETPPPNVNLPLTTRCVAQPARTPAERVTNDAGTQARPLAGGRAPSSRPEGPHMYSHTTTQIFTGPGRQPTDCAHPRRRMRRRNHDSRHVGRPTPQTHPDKERSRQDAGAASASVAQSAAARRGPALRRRRAGLLLVRGRARREPASVAEVVL